MKRLLLSLCVFSLTVAAWAQGNGNGNGNGKTELNLPDPPMLGRHFVRGEAGLGSPFKSPNLSYHNGPVLTSPSNIQAIFWGTKWANASFAADKIDGPNHDGNGGLDAFYKGADLSFYTGTNTEYTDTTALHVSSRVSYQGHSIDTTAAPSKAPSTSAILNEVCKVVGSNVTARGYYPVYVDTPRGSANYCAWHSWGSCNGTPIEFGFFFNLDGDPGCDPGDASGQHSQGLAALANVSGHELSETMTDPSGNAWYDNQGSENADKCAWSFGTPLVTLANGTQWMIQGNWSNTAYAAGTGYANRSGQKGCLDGGNYK